jgi:hypothetical protein
VSQGEIVTEPLLWFVVGAVAMAALLLAPRFVRGQRQGIDVNDRGRRYEWAKDGEL